MAIISEKYYGSAKVTVYDDYCHDTPEEKARRKERIDNVISRILSAPGALERLTALYAKEDAGA